MVSHSQRGGGGSTPETNSAQKTCLFIRTLPLKQHFRSIRHLTPNQETMTSIDLRNTLLFHKTQGQFPCLTDQKHKDKYNDRHNDQ